MKRWLGLLTVVSFVFFAGIPAFGSVDFTGQVSTTLQGLESEQELDGTGIFQSNNEEIGFGDALFNLQVRGDVADGVTGFAEVHNNAWQSFSGGAGLSTAFERDPNDIDLREAYLTFHDLIPNADVKVGRVDLLFGTQYMDRSVNARVQDNPLIGNHLNDFGGPETGVHVGGEYRMFDWYAAVTNGTREATVNEGQGLAFTGTAGFDIFTAGYLKGSYYRSNQDEDLIGSGIEQQSQFAVAEGESYLLEDDWRSSIALIYPRVRAWQVDAMYDIENPNLKLSGYFGNLRFDAIDREGDYWNAQVDWRASSRSGLAGRYGEIEFEDFDFVVDRTQIGYYYSYNENTLAKLEYVNQEIEGTYPIGGGGLPSFDGFTGELSIAF